MNYETVIGLEIHCELSTNSKIFCSCKNKFGSQENTQCCPICTGMPGTLPVLNRRVVEYAIRAGLAMKCKISEYSKMDRKNYFYPDLPKAYQTSQFDLPLCLGGYIDIDVEGEMRRIGITRIHIEEDAGKLIHDDMSEYTKIDLNRCGVPLIEIVTEPDLRSSKEVAIFLDTVRNILRYIDVSDCKMQEGSLRCDVNLSMRPQGQEKLGIRSEMKNLNSFQAATRAIEFERKRHTDILSKGGEIEQETRRWDDQKGQSYSMRSKEDAQDYRYFPEPDLVPIVFDPDEIEKIKSSLPELPSDKRIRYIDKLGLSDYDATLISSQKGLAFFLDDCVEAGSDPKLCANWLMGDISRILNDRAIDPECIPFPAAYLVKLISLINDKTITGPTAKKVLTLMFDEQKSPDEIVKEHNMASIADVSAIKSIVSDVLSANQKSVDDYKAGKTQAMGYLIGQVMRASKGTSDPETVKALLSDMLNQ